MLLLLAVLLILPFGSLSANLPGEPWSKGEVARTKERLWNILNNPGKFVKKNKVCHKKIGLIKYEQTIGLEFCSETVAPRDK